MFSSCDCVSSWQNVVLETSTVTGSNIKVSFGTLDCVNTFYMFPYHRSDFLNVTIWHHICVRCRCVVQITVKAGFRSRCGSRTCWHCSWGDAIPTWCLVMNFVSRLETENTFCKDGYYVIWLYLYFRHSWHSLCSGVTQSSDVPWNSTFPVCVWRLHRNTSEGGNK